MPIVSQAQNRFMHACQGQNNIDGCPPAKVVNEFIASSHGKHIPKAQHVVDGKPVRRRKGDVPGHEFHGNQYTNGGHTFNPVAANAYPVKGLRASYRGEFFHDKDYLGDLHKTATGYRILNVNMGRTSHQSDPIDPTRVERFDSYRVSAARSINRYRMKS